MLFDTKSTFDIKAKKTCEFTNIMLTFLHSHVFLGNQEMEACTTRRQ